MRVQWIVVALCAALTPVLAQALELELAPSLAEVPPPPAGVFGGELSAGYLATSGNSDTRTLNAKVALHYGKGFWKDAFVATALGGAERGVSIAERYAADDKLSYNFTERNYAFGEGGWAKDLFGPVRQLITETVGYGRNVLPGPVHTLDIDLGAGARQQIINGNDQHQTDAIGHFGLGYDWAISPTSSFGEKFKIDSGRANTFTESVTELKLSIIGNLFAALSYTFRHNSVAAPGLGKTDTITAANLSYDFGAK